MSLEPPAEDAAAAPTGTALLRAVAASMAAIRHALEHGDVAAARHAARHLTGHLDALPDAREDYERLCDEADRELAANPNAWDQNSEGGR